MSVFSWFFRIVLKREKETILEAGDVALTRTVFNISRISRSDDEVVRISGKPPLRLPKGGRITVRDAHDDTGKSKSTLRRWSRRGRVDARKVKRRWLLDRDSVNEYSKENG